MCVADVAHVNVAGGSLKRHITVKSFGVKRAGAGAKNKAGIRRDLHLVIYTARLGIRAREQVRKNIDSIAALRLINFYFPRVRHRDDYDLVGSSRLNRNRAIFVGNGNGGMRTHNVAKVLAPLAGCESGTRQQKHC